ncbi:hypothetical protein [Nesterenkonia pannonica]|uniref:arsenate reductase/protein-tyrosine-phosphatase family protein n=1 Tax=Nesterenkonia pannonica TaxID=1548602 RepID=UPI002164AA2B|nr:hypothetical protein [Nesterenkonia pannonica]
MVIAAPELIFLCRANRCRSPLAEHLTRDKAYRLGLGVTVSSAGLLRPGELTPQVGIRAAAQA